MDKNSGNPNVVSQINSLQFYLYLFSSLFMILSHVFIYVFIFKDGCYCTCWSKLFEGQPRNGEELLGANLLLLFGATKRLI